MTTRKPKTQTAEKRTYLLEMSDGTRKKVTVPAAWKVTFDAFQPGSLSGSSQAHAPTIRFYEGSKENQRAVITGVQAFRDMSIGIEEEIVKTQEETFSRETDEGIKNVAMNVSVKTWVNPDANPVNSEPQIMPVKRLIQDRDLKIT
jgi:hypothetical protein